MKDTDIEYELKVDTHVECRKYNIIEGIKVNFDATLDDIKVGKYHPARDILVQRVRNSQTSEILESDRELLIYRVIINDNKNAKAILESWKESHKFDDLAFRGAVRDKFNIRIKNIKRI